MSSRFGSKLRLPLYADVRIPMTHRNGVPCSVQNPYATDEAPGPPFSHRLTGSVVGLFDDVANVKKSSVPFVAGMYPE